MPESWSTGQGQAWGLDAEGLSFGYMSVKHLFRSPRWNCSPGKYPGGSGMELEDWESLFGFQTPAEAMGMVSSSSTVENTGRIHVGTSPYRPPRTLPLARSLQCN